MSIVVLSILVEIVNVVVLFNPLNAELNPICHLLELLGAHLIFHVSGLRVKIHVCRMMGSFCRGAPFMVYVERFSTY